MTVLPTTQKAVVLHPEPGDIRLEVIPVPTIEDADDAIVKILFAGLCGSDLHAYRGHELSDTPFIMGHELVGEVVALGSSFTPNAPKDRPTLYRSLRIGDTVLSPFSVSCMECEYCSTGFTSRCIHSKLFGSPSQPGAQAQYIRIPKAGGNLTVVRDTKIESIESTLLLADIVPTGFFAAKNALGHPNVSGAVKGKGLFLAVIGLGPVGLCAVLGALQYITEMRDEERPTAWSFLLVDTNEARRVKAKTMLDSILSEGGCDSLEIHDPEGANDCAKRWGGVHAVCEVVGNNPALRLAYDLLRPFGVISSVGVHTAPQFPLTGGELYSKNVSLSFGRCPARHLLDVATRILIRHQALFQVGEGLFIERVVGIGKEDGEERMRDTYRLFNEGAIGKVIFDPWN